VTEVSTPETGKCALKARSLILAVSAYSGV